ncbi:MAG: DUF1836 domain-containing protein [Clostridia bacterium]|nr:DUF1836 domain-containing protein [Clostridia bacterium]
MKKALMPTAPPSWADFPDIELYMDQVISVLEKHLSPYFEEKCITSTMINNYVKQKLIPPPQNKRYTRGQLARLFMICILKSFMQLSDIAALLDELCKPRSQEETYSLFSAELNEALLSVFGGAKPSQEAAAPVENALHTALTAFAAILYARQSFRRAEAELIPPATEETKEKKKKEDKSEKKKKD